MRQSRETLLNFPSWLPSLHSGSRSTVQKLEKIVMYSKHSPIRIQHNNQYKNYTYLVTQLPDSKYEIMRFQYNFSGPQVNLVKWHRYNFCKFISMPVFLNATFSQKVLYNFCPESASLGFGRQKTKEESFDTTE